MADPRDSDLTRNAADVGDVKRAGRREKERERQWVMAYRAVLATREGRQAFADLLERAGVFDTIWTPVSEALHYAVGRQSIGQELRARLIYADEAMFELLEREARARFRSEQAGNAAAHTARADTQERSDG